MGSKPFFIRIFAGTVCAACLAATLAGAARASDWKPADGPLATKWAKDVSPENALPEYPRPQMERQEWMNLNGLWEYSISAKSDSKIPYSYDGNILVPYPIESSLSGVMERVDQTQYLWYRRSFDVPEKWRQGRVSLHFGAVDWEAVVWVNGKQAGEHRGGYDSFTFDITGLLVADARQEIVVRVFDPTDAGYQPRGKQVQRPNGIWYTPTSGIWGTVWLEPVPKTYIASLKIVPDIDSKSISVTADVAGDECAECNVDVRIKTGDEKYDAPKATGAPSASGKGGQVLTVSFPKDLPPELWSPDSPKLYPLSVCLRNPRAEKTEQPVCYDSVQSYAGMRKVSVQKDASGTPRIFLNNKPLFMYGPLDQGFWPDGLYTAPTEEALKFDIEVTKKLGFNMTRKHVKVEPERWYYWCDKLGLLVWQDMPSGDMTGMPGMKEMMRTKKSSNQYRQELKAIIDNLHNHPSIVVWVPFNEGWGQFDTVKTGNWVKEYDPSRLVDHASGWHDMKSGDINDIHRYPEPGAPPVEAYRAAVVGEFGGLGMSVAGHTWREGLERISGSESAGDKNWGYRDFTEKEKIWQQYKTLVLLLRDLIKNKGLSAAVYTQITDVEIEVNGLLTYDREEFKFDTDKVAAENKRLYETMPEK